MAKRIVQIEKNEPVTGVWVSTLRRGGVKEVFITALPVEGEPLRQLFDRVGAVLKDEQTSVVSQDVFGIPDEEGEGLSTLVKSLGPVEWPVTWIMDGAPPLSGIQVWAISGVEVEPVVFEGQVVGTIFEDSYGRFCRLGDVRPKGTGAREDQAYETFERMEKILATVGMSFSNVFRTWLYNNDILDWYDGFNRARNAFFKERGIFEGLVPASTGIGGRHSSGVPLVAAALAGELKDGSVKVFSIPSPLQCGALDYGSSFSRAVECATSDFRKLYISGTASISEDGRTAHVGDMGSQVELTMQVVGAILESRGMGWPDVTRGVAYVKHSEDAGAYRRHSAANKLPSLPIILTENDVCRPELLFEIEVDAVKV